MTTPIEKQRCENCHYHPEFSNQCRRNAPQPGYEGDRLAFWPGVAGDDWCGEWAQR